MVTSIVLALATPFAGFHITMLVAGSIGLIRPNRTVLGAVGLVALGASALGAKRLPLAPELAPAGAAWLHVVSPAGLLVVAALSLWIACGRPRGELAARFDVVAAAALLGIPVSGWLLIAARAGTDLGAMSALVGPDLQLAALGLAGAAFAAVRGRPGRSLFPRRRR